MSVRYPEHGGDVARPVDVLEHQCAVRHAPDAVRRVRAQHRHVHFHLHPSYIIFHI